jgi:hypothetical protein
MLDPNRASSPGDLLRTVTERSEDLVAFRVWRTAEEGLAKEGVDVFPDNLPLSGHLEEAAKGRLGD